MLPRKNFENLHTVVAILVLFEQFLFKIFTPKPECFTKYDADYSHIFRYACLGVRLVVIKKVRNYEKIVFIDNMFENG